MARSRSRKFAPLPLRKLLISQNIRRNAHIEAKYKKSYSYLKRGVKMSLVPNFEMGLWNAWIFMLYHQLLCIVLLGSKGLLIKSSAATPHKKLGGKL